MSAIEEIDISREGGSVGVFGSRGHSTSWYVNIDDAEDDPISVMASLRGGPRVGSPYPGSSNKRSRFGTWDPNGLVALFATRRRRETPFLWIVDVFYGPPVLFEVATPGWEISLASGLETELVFHDLDGTPVGPYDYGLPLGSGLVGPLNVTHTAKTNRGEINLFVASAETGDFARKVEGATRRRGVGRLTMTRISANFNQDAISRALGASGMVNNADFWISLRAAGSRGSILVQRIKIASKGLLIFEDASIVPILATVIGQTVPGQAWRASLTMGFDPLGWQHRLTHWYVDDQTGARSLVRTLGGGRVQETFRMQEGTDFASIVGNFE